MYDHDFSQTDIYVVDILNHEIKRLTETDHNESHPIWSKTENSIFYTSDFNGVWNLYKQDLEVERFPRSCINKCSTGLQQPTISNNDEMIIFAGYSGIGWDLYSISNPNKLKQKQSNQPILLKIKTLIKKKL